jgi:hypothetical protein
MTGNRFDDDSGEELYQEREAVAVFSDEASLNNAVDALMQFGLRQADMSVLAHAESLSATKEAKQLGDEDNVPRSNYVSPDSRTEAAAAIAGGPALIAGLSAALAISTAGVALIPAIAVTAGSALASGGLGLVLSRVFGRRHAAYVERQIMSGGLLLWVHAPDEKNDAKIVDILKQNGGRDAHIHVVNRTWGVGDVPFHDSEPDPLLRR